MAALTGQTLAATYKGLLKTKGDNVAIPTGSTAVQIVDGEEGDTALYITNDQVGIGTDTPLGVLHLGSVFVQDTILTIEKWGLDHAAQITFKSTTDTAYEWFMGMADGGGPNPGTGHEFFISSNQTSTSGMVTGIPAIWIEGDTQDIGISKSDVSARLHLYDNTTSRYAAIFEQNHGTGYGVKIAVDSENTSHPALRIENGAGQPILDLKSDGFLGLGTMYPEHHLHVTNPTGEVELALTRDETTISNNDILGSISFGGRDDLAVSTRFIGASIEAEASGDWTASGNVAPTQLNFRVKNDAFVGVTRCMTIEGNGNVAIGAAEPDDDARLDIQMGDLKFSNTGPSSIMHKINGASYNNFKMSMQSGLGIYTGNGVVPYVQKLWLSLDGELGLGTHNGVDHMLHISSSSRRPQIFLEDYAEVFVGNQDFMRIGCGEDVGEQVIGFGAAVDELIIGKYGTGTDTTINKYIRINQMGSVGIGGNSPPATLLDVTKDVAAGELVRIYNTSSTSAVGTTGLWLTGGQTGRNNQYPLRCSSLMPSRDLFCVTADARLGLKTEAPSSSLHIVGDDEEVGADSFVGNGITIENTSAATTSEVGIRLSNFDTGANYWYTGLNEDKQYEFSYGATFQAANTELTIFASSEMDASVAIGSTAPCNTFSIAHNATALDNGMVIYNENATISSGDLLGVIGFDGVDGALATNPLTASAYIAGYAAQDHGAAKGGDLAFGCTEIGDAASVTSHEHMRIHNNGHISMGTASTAGLTVGNVATDTTGRTGTPIAKFHRGGGPNNWIGFYGDAGASYLVAGDDGNNQKPFYIAASASTLSSREIVFQTQDTDQTTWHTRMTIAGAGSVSIPGALSKGSGSFKIDHPIPSMKDTHDLVHSFVESPKADLIYRGTVDLVSGSATVNIDIVAGMTDGTFVLLCDDIQCFTTNESNWDLVKGSVSGNTLTLSSENTDSTASISWMVIGDRKDEHIMGTAWTDANGKPIIEPLKETIEEEGV